MSESLWEYFACLGYATGRIGDFWVSFKLLYSGGSGNKLHYNFCPTCGTFIYNKPDLLDPMIYVPAGLLDGQIEFTPTVELWTSQKPNNIPQATSTKAAFEDNGTTDRLMDMLENLDQRG